MCMCSTCVSPDVCDDGNKCTDQPLQDGPVPGLKCCSTPQKKPCPSADKCNPQACNTTTGSCDIKPLICVNPNPTNSCVITNCSAAFGCQTINWCDTTTCNDGNECTVDTLDVNNPTTRCKFEPKVCNPRDSCHTATCDPAVSGGCVNVPIDVSTCDDFNNCTVDSCDPTSGCVHLNTSMNCNDTLACTDDYCDPLQGCAAKLKECPDHTNGCELGTCNEGVCEFIRPTLCLTEKIAIGLSTGAIIGIVVGVVVAAVACSAAAFKGVQYYNANHDLDNVGQNNPLYEMGGEYGQSGIYVASK